MSNQVSGSTYAVIYARVSSPAQTVRGDGLGSQETRCREFARMKGYEVAKVFQDDMTGQFADRPGMQDMLDFLRANRKDAPIVIIDDITRLARGVIAHWDLRDTIAKAGGKLESPSIEFGEDSDSVLVENLLASVSQHQREKNAEQTKNRMQARIMNGYWCFQAPIGYKYSRVSGHGNMLVRDEPVASVIQEALEGFASGHFQTQAEVKRFLEVSPSYPKPNKSGSIHPQRIIEILTRPVYAGMVEAPNWNIPMRQGQHKGLISLTDYNRIQNRLKATAKAPARKDLSADFPLRGAVTCDDCGHALTACWSQGKNRKYAYYLCPTKGCASYRKSIPRDKIESAFATLLQNMTPSQPMLNAAKAMFRDLWEQRLTQAASIKATFQKDADRLGKQIDELLDRVIDASTPSIIRAYEQRIATLETEKLAIHEKLQSTGKPVATFQEMFEHAMEYL